MPLSIGNGDTSQDTSYYPCTTYIPLLHVFQLLKDTDSFLFPIGAWIREVPLYILYRGVASVSLVCPATAARDAARGGAVGVA